MSDPIEEKNQEIENLKRLFNETRELEKFFMLNFGKIDVQTEDIEKLGLGGYASGLLNNIVREVETYKRYFKHVRESYKIDQLEWIKLTRELED